MTEILETQNKEWGFWGTTKNIVISGRKTQKAWNEAFKLISEIADFTPEETRDLLDSRWGRHTADNFYDELQQGVFAKEFKRRITKQRLYSDYSYYVSPDKYGDKIPQRYKDFCKELKTLTLKYNIVIQAVGGVIQNTEGFQGYNADLDSGDLMPEWEN